MGAGLRHYVLGSALFASYALVNVHEAVYGTSNSDPITPVRHFILNEKLSVLVSSLFLFFF